MIDYLSRLLKTDVRYVLGGGLWLLLGQGIAFAASFTLLWVFTNFLPRDTYGQYRFITTVALLLSIATLPGINIALLQGVANGHTGLLKPLLQTKMRWGYVGSVGALIGSIYYWFQADTTLSLLFLIVASFVPFFESLNVYQSYLMGKKEFRSNALLTASLRIFIVLSLCLAILISKSIVVIILVFFVSSTLAHLLAFLIAKQIHRPTKVASKEIDDASSYGLHLTTMSVFRLASQHLDKIALWYFAGPVQVAVYAIAVALPNELTSASGQVSNLALPKMSARRAEELRKTLLRKVFIFFLALIPLTVTYILIAPSLFYWFFPQYLDTVFYTQVAALSILIAPFGLLSQYFYATKHTRVLYITNLLEPAILVALFAILIPMYGVLGAICAFITKHVITFFMYLYFFFSDSRTEEDHHSLATSV